MSTSPIPSELLHILHERGLHHPATAWTIQVTDKGLLLELSWNQITFPKANQPLYEYKKKSPSVLKRDKARREAFLKKKQAAVMTSTAQQQPQAAATQQPQAAAAATQQHQAAKEQQHLVHIDGITSKPATQTEQCSSSTTFPYHEHPTTVHKVKRILDKRFRDGSNEYCVQLQGQSAQQSIWIKFEKLDKEAQLKVYYYVGKDFM